MVKLEFDFYFSDFTVSIGQIQHSAPRYTP
jgi:hypothetical protein